MSTYNRTVFCVVIDKSCSVFKDPTHFLPTLPRFCPIDTLGITRLSIPVNKNSTMTISSSVKPLASISLRDFPMEAEPSAGSLFSPLTSSNLAFGSTILILLHIPIRDIGVDAFSPGFAVRRVRRDFIIGLDLSILPLLNRRRAQILVWIPPGIFGNTGQVPIELPFFRHDINRRFLDQGLETLLGRRVHTIVEFVQLECTFNITDLDLRSRPLRIVRSSHNPWHYQCGEDGENRDDYHDFDEREAALRSEHCCAVLYRVCLCAHRYLLG